MELTRTKLLLLCGALYCMASSILAQAKVEFLVEPGIHFDLFSLDQALGISSTAVDFPKGETRFQLEFEHNKPLLLTAGDTAHIFLVRDRHTYTITVGGDAIEINSEDPYHPTMKAANALFDSYTLSGIDGDVLLARFAQIEARYDSIKALHPNDKYLHTALDYSRLNRYIDLAVKLQDAAAVAAFYRLLESEYILPSQVQFYNPHYRDFVGNYYYWKSQTNTFSDYKPDGDLPSFERLQGELALLDDKTIAKLATMIYIGKNCEGQDSGQIDEFTRVVNAIQLSLDEHGMLSIDILKQSTLLLHKLKQLSVGAPVSNHAFTSTKGDTIQLSDYKGSQYVLLDFWTIRCAPCRKHIPTIKALHAEYGSELKIIAANPVDSMERVADFQNAQNIPYTMAIPASWTEIKQELNAMAFPRYVIIDKEGHTALFAGSSIENVQYYLEKHLNTGRK